MMGVMMPETCWAGNKRQDNKLKNCCIRLMIYLNCAMMHGLTNFKFYIYILAHPVCKMWIIHEPKKVKLWNKRHFAEKNGECTACLKYYLLKKYIKWNIWRVVVRPSYIQDARFLKVNGQCEGCGRSQSCLDVRQYHGIFVGDGETSTAVRQNGTCLNEIGIRIQVMSFTILAILLDDLLLHLLLLCCL
jgi:hypothetical protein